MRYVSMHCRWIVLVLAAIATTTAAEALVVSNHERAWIAAHPVIRIQMSDCSPPFEFKEHAVWKGMSYDILVEAASRIGMRVEATGISWAQALDTIQGAHEVDLLLAVTRSEERERQMSLTAPYVSFPQVVFADKRHAFLGGIDDLAHSRIAVENDYVMVDWLKRDLPKATLIMVPDSGAALAAVSTGQAEAYIGNLAVGSWLIDHHGLTNLAVVAPTEYGDEDFSMGIRTDWPELVSLLNRAIAAIPPEEMSAIRQRWLSIRYEHGLRASDILFWVLIVGAIALAFIIPLRLLVNRRTRELKSEVELRRAKEHHLEQAQRIAHVGSWSEDTTGDLHCSPETRQLLGWADAAPKRQDSVMAIVHPDDVQQRQVQHARARQQPGNIVDCEFRVQRRDGTQRHIQESCQAVCDAQGTAIGLDGVLRDITDVKQAEKERSELQRSLLHSEKMRVLGQLAGGFAHDFNNLLSSISGNTELLLHSLNHRNESPERLRVLAQRILAATGHAAGISAQLRHYSRRDPIAVKPIEVHGLIREASELVWHGAPRAMTITLNLNASESIALGDAAQLETALINLALNAHDAMPNGGTLTFSTTVVTLNKPVAHSHAFDFIPGRYLEIAISDTGMGMDASVLAHLFEPFFTTKESGRGTGLGLANVYACVKHHRGAIAVDSTVGQGSTFRIWLPLAPAGTPSVPTAHITGTGTVLVVDDDPALRTLAADMLSVLGYRCILAADGDEAIARCAEQPVDLVLLDMIMPKRDGGQTIPLLRLRDRTIRILLCSGSVQDDVEALQHGANGFLRKPYQLSTFSQAVASMIKKPH